jgi:hypothetical protein
MAGLGFLAGFAVGGAPRAHRARQAARPHAAADRAAARRAADARHAAPAPARTFFVLPVYLQVVLGLDAFETGASLGTALIGAVLIGALTTRFVENVEQNPAIPAAVRQHVAGATAKGIPVAPSTTSRRRRARRASRPSRPRRSRPPTATRSSRASRSRSSPSPTSRCSRCGSRAGCRVASRCRRSRPSARRRPRQCRSALRPIRIPPITPTAAALSMAPGTREPDSRAPKYP